jgi:hypothetical protein
MSDELSKSSLKDKAFPLRRNECAEWLAEQTWQAIAGAYQFPFSEWAELSQDQRAYCRRMAIQSIQQSDTFIVGWKQAPAAGLPVAATDRVAPSGGDSEPLQLADANVFTSGAQIVSVDVVHRQGLEPCAWRVTLSDGRHGDTSSRWLVRCAKGWMDNKSAVNAQIAYCQDQPDTARLIDLNVASVPVGADRTYTQ